MKKTIVLVGKPGKGKCHFLGKGLYAKNSIPLSLGISVAQCAEDTMRKLVDLGYKVRKRKTKEGVVVFVENIEN